jgi:hypothetical protein
MTWSSDTNTWSTDCNTWSSSQIDCVIVGVCRWAGDNITWGNENTIWSKCVTCVKWGTDNIWWKNENLIWSHCSSSVIPPTPPPPTPVVTASLQRFGIDATTLVQPWLIEPWNPYTANDKHDKKRKKLIKLVCKIKGQTYEEEKEAGDMKVSVEDIKMVVNAMRGIDLDVKLEE